MDADPWIRALGLAAGGAVFWMVYFDLKDAARPEPRRLLALAFLVGSLATIPTLMLYRVLETGGIALDFQRGPVSVAAYCVLVVGPVEEGVKFLVARTIVFRFRAFDERMDGVIYAAMVAIGFATAENLLYATFLSPLEQAARALAAPLIHALFASIWGFAAARAILVETRTARRVALQAGALAIAMLLHGAYDAALLAWQAPVVSSAVVAVMWVGLIVATRAVTRRAARAPAGSRTEAR